MNRTRLIATVVAIIVVLSGASVALWYFVFRNDDPDPVASCGDCYCIVPSGDSCPSPAPEMSFSDDLVRQLSSHKILNSYSVYCNPYDDDDCKTEPPQTLTELGENAICGIKYIETTEGQNSSASCYDRSYNVVSYQSRAAAEADGAVVSHTGACGLCSSTQDLAVYLGKPDLTTAASKCVKETVPVIGGGIDDSIECLKELGMTEGCAKIWTFNGRNTAEDCFAVCVQAKVEDWDNNGPPPECKLNDCLQCDEENSGPIFWKFSGRIRRRSGILTAIARPCETIADITHVACPRTKNERSF